MDVTQQFGIRLNYGNTDTNGNLLPGDARVSYVFEIVSSDGDTVWYPPLDQPGLPDTSGDVFEAHVSGEGMGLAVGTYTVYAHTHVDYSDGTGKFSARADGVPLVFRDYPIPAAPSGVEFFAV